MTEDRQGRLPPVATFEDLEVFKRAYRLSLDVHRRSLELPAVEQRALADQIRRASKSICANLAEGFGRQGVSTAEFKRFVMMAMGSADEMRLVVPLLSRPRLHRCGDMADVATGVPRDRADAAGPAPQLALGVLLSSVVCHLSFGPVAERSVGR